MRDKQTYNNYQKRYQLERYHRRRQTAIVYLGGKCSICGSTDKLEIDHKNPSLKTLDLGRLWSVSEKRYLEELPKCQLLCKDHHIQKSQIEDAVRRPVTHGKYWAAYKHKCKCDECLVFIVHYNKERQEKRKASKL